MVNEMTDMTQRIRICCPAMDDLVLLNDIRESIIESEGQLWLWWKDGDMTPLRFCPTCGKRIEVDE